MSPVNVIVKPITPDLLYAINKAFINAEDIKSTLDIIVKPLRGSNFFDKLALYSFNKATQTLEVLYAKAMGRGHSAGADIYWGEDIASKINSTHIRIIHESPLDPQDNRLNQPFALGLPLAQQNIYLGTMVVIRYGGPPFQQEDINLWEFVASQIAFLMACQNLQQEYHRLYDKNKQTQLQEDFISTITHELRNPIGFIKGFTTTLLRSDATWDQKTQHEFLQIIDRETDHLQELIENFLDSAQLQSGLMQISMEKVRLDSVLKSLITRLKLHKPDVVISSTIDGNLKSVLADPRRLTQVLDNIISNAIKYAPESEILITIKDIGTGALIGVQDFGPGIAPEYLPQVFDRFFRVPDQAPNVHGSGLGLYISKSLIQAHHGDISLESIVDKGTKFTIFLPYQNDHNLTLEKTNDHMEGTDGKE
jgi:signal transduction histidine kinase